MKAELFYLKLDNIDLMIDTTKIKKEDIYKTHVKMPLDININSPYEAFEIYNGDKNPLISPENQIFIRNTRTHTSMSVGDVIFVNGLYYLCENIGWRVL